MASSWKCTYMILSASCFSLTCASSFRKYVFCRFEPLSSSHLALMFATLGSHLFTTPLFFHAR